MIVVVLGEALTSNKPGKILKQRVEAAIKIPAEKYIMSGAYCFTTKKIPPKTEAQAMKEYALSLGINKNKIIKEEKSKDTIGNAYFTKQIIKNNTFLVITSDFHKERVEYIFEKVFKRKIKVIGVKTGLTERFVKDQAILTFTELLLNDVSDFKEFIYKFHPGYAKRPIISLEKWLKMSR